MSRALMEKVDNVKKQIGNLENVNSEKEAKVNARNQENHTEIKQKHET